MTFGCSSSFLPGVGSPVRMRSGPLSERFRKLCKRRGQTEARIGIFKNVFPGVPLLAKGYGNQSRHVA